MPVVRPPTGHGGLRSGCASQDWRYDLGGSGERGDAILGARERSRGHSGEDRGADRGASGTAATRIGGPSRRP